MTKYIHQKFEEKKNIDIYFKRIYDNIYSKNYIGFESYEQMELLMKADLRNLYLRMVPNFPSTIISIFCALALLILCCFSICRLNYKDVPNDHGDESCITLSKCLVGFFYFIIFVGYYIYFIYAYCKIYKNPELIKIKKIKSDTFIEDFINEITKGKNKALILIIIILMSISFVFFILTWLFKPLHQMYLKSLNKQTIKKETKINIIDEKNIKIVKDLESSNTKINDKKNINNLENINEKLDEKNNIKDLEKNDVGGISNNSNNNLKEGSTKIDDSNATK